MKYKTMKGILDTLKISPEELLFMPLKCEKCEGEVVYIDFIERKGYKRPRMLCIKHYKEIKVKRRKTK